MKKKNIKGLSAVWPDALDEDATLDAALSGKSMARYGDGELRLCLGGNSKSQVYSKPLGIELRRILQAPAPDCIVASLRARADTPKAWFWNKVIANRKYIALHNPKVTYYSHWITRPDSAPWIDRADYWEKILDLWRDKDVILVAGSERSLNNRRLALARSVQMVECPYTHAYAVIDDLEKRCLDLEAKTVLLCAGAAATCLADRLSRHGKHALDLGHLGFMEGGFKHYGKF